MASDKPPTEVLPTAPSKKPLRWVSMLGRNVTGRCLPTTPHLLFALIIIADIVIASQLKV